MPFRITFPKYVIAGLLLMSLPAWSGALEDAMASRDRGDFTAAFNAFKQLAAHGEANAQFQLSLLYAAGKGVRPDAPLALYWLKQAATRGNIQAQSNLGVVFNRGRGIPQDEIKAYAWFTMAAKEGDVAAATNRDVAARKLTPAQLEQAKTLAVICQQESYKPCL
jgi:TPR repeat protein